MSLVLGAQILVCDDSDVERLYACKALAAAGFSRIYPAKTWAEAKDICRNQPMDCCVIDLLMQEGEGTALIGELRQLPGYARVPMIIITASELREKSWLCLENGADDFVTKPYPQKTLAIRVNLHVERYIAESRYRNLVENMSSGVLVFRPVGDGSEFEIVSVNKACERILQLTRKTVVDRAFSEVFADSLIAPLLTVLQRVSQSAGADNCCITHYAEAQLSKWLEFYIYRLSNQELVAVCDDLTEKMRAVEELKKTTQRLKLAAEGARFGVWELNLADYTFYWDDRVYSINGLVPGEFDLKLSSWLQLLPPDDVVKVQEKLAAALAGENEYDLEFRVLKPSSNELAYIKCHGIVTYTADNTPEYLTGISYDITAQKLAELKLEEAAITDKLTGLYNRHYLYERLQELLDKHLRDESVFALAVIDLDNFKQVNDRYGHIAGDKVLQHFAGFLRSHLRSYDITARFGGEEFVVVFLDTDKVSAGKLCQRILDNLALETVRAGDFEIGYSFTAGISDIRGWNRQTDGIDHLISTADNLLYKGKVDGRKQVVSE